MATIASAVLEDVTHKIATTALMSGAPLFDWTVSPASDASLPPYEPITQLRLEDYQIVLVPFQDGRGRPSGVPQRAGRMGQFLLLPLTWKELVTRVCNAVVHSGSAQDTKTARFGRVCVDFVSMEVTRCGRPVSLRAMEFRALKFFVSNPRRVVTRDELLNEVWGYDN
jgi:hypothetical protein